MRKRRRITRNLIAHEFGHFLIGLFFDKDVLPQNVVFNEGDLGSGDQAYQESDVISSVKNYTISMSVNRKDYHNVTAIWHLGGIIGELLYGNKFSPWTARADIDEFLTSVRHKPSGKISKEIANEMYDWFYSISETPHNFSYYARHAKNKKYPSMPDDEIKEIFPRFHSVYVAIDEVFPGKTYRKLINSLTLRNDKYLFWIDIVSYIRKFYPEQYEKIVNSQT